MPSISKRTVDALRTSGRIGSFIWDEDLLGFGARLNADGTVSYVVQYRTGRGRGYPTRRMVLGKHGKLTAEEARGLAKTTLADAVKAIENGQPHPAAKRTTRKQEQTVADLLNYAIENHWKAKGRKSARAFEEMINRTLTPQFGKMRLSELRRVEIRDWHARQTHRPRQANLDLAILRKALSIAVHNEWLTNNPAVGIEKHRENERNRILSNNEIKALWGALNTAPIRLSAALLFKLLALTGCRTSEWTNAKWTDFDAQLQVLRLPDAKAGKRDVPLTPSVLALLEAADKRSDFIIPNDAGIAPLTRSNIRDAWARVLEATGITDLHVHDLRHAFATRGAALGANALILRDALGHKTLAMTSRYVANQHDPVRDLSRRIATQIVAIASGGCASVIPIKKADSA